jgi:hypothetical protein
LDSCNEPSCFLIVATGPDQSVFDLYWVLSCGFNLSPSILLANHITLFSTFCSTIIKLHAPIIYIYIVDKVSFSH